MNVRTIVAAADPEIRKLYQQQVSSLGADCDTAASLHEMFEQMKEIPYNGLLIDLPTLVKANQVEKAQCHELLRLFPTLRLRWDQSSQKLLCLLYGSHPTDNMSLKLFIDEHCQSFTARRIRRFQRMRLHYNVLLASDEDFRDDDVERSTSIDISEGGCSLITGRDRPLESNVWLRFIEFEDQTPIQASICSRIPWGTAMKIPSIGVSFTTISEAQLEQIRHPGKAIYEKKLKS
ncbi:PilZ domain-containing protein [Malonomonas rubra DSM 5091]|uniref:PilZ domain-containing protein n=1 Tax=Malonomonas rubra DSM 5091 TaxID=1122189 RepID=A0A1M6I0L6_MALRU|nr:PilZ domain-containing protein [Malonomonas rubra]SHJ28036.1 PilZ domain-containing protein [Malonomonas rubra DSM 5091]